MHSRDQVDRIIVWALVVGAGIGGAFAGCHPTRTPGLDPLYTALLAGLLTLASSRAARGTLLLFAAVALALGRSWVVVPAGVALVAAFIDSFGRRANPVLGALVGALSVEAVLRWPALGFQGFTALIAGTVMLVVAVAAILTLSRRLRIWIGALTFGLLVLGVLVSVAAGLAALQARTAVTSGIDAAQSALGSVSDGDASAGTTELRQASADFHHAAQSTGAWWTVGARLVPIVAQQRQALAQSVSVAEDVAGVSAQEAGSIDFGQLRYQDGGIDLAKVAALSGPLAVVDHHLSAATSRLAAVRSPWLVSPIQSRLARLDSEVVKADNSASLASEAVQAAPSLLGGDGVRHYFVAFLNPSESRALGGLISSYGELTVNQGHIKLTTAADISVLNADLVTHGGGHITGPPDYLARYGAFHPQQFFQDLSYSPDMPTVSSVIAQLYAQAGGGNVDGVLALDPQALASLLSLSGPVQVPGLGQLSSSNAAEVLLKDQYALYPAASQQVQRRDYQQAALAEAFRQLSTGSLPGPRSLSDALDTTVRQGNLLLWSFHPSDQALLERLGLAGSFPTTGGGDVLALVTQNAATNKIDAYLQRSITDHVAYDPGDGEVQSTVTITLHNEAPASGLSDQVIGSFGGSGLPKGTNLTWLSFYSPLDLISSTQDGQAYTMTPVRELGVETYSGFVQIPAGGTVTLTLRLQGQIKKGKTYQLSVRSQPMVLPDQDLVTVTASGGYHTKGITTWTPDPVLTPRHVFSFGANS